MAYMVKTRLKLSCLPPNIKDDHFQSLFASVGQLVECRVVRDENTGLCVGSGFVEYETEYEAKDAIKMLNGKVVHNKCIKVAHLVLTDDRVPSTKLQIENLPTWCTFSMLGLKFSDFGEVIGCRTETDPQTGLPNGVGFVEFGAKEEAIRAKNCLTGTVLEGASMPLAISFVESQYNEGYNAEENYAGGNNAGSNEFFNSSYGGSCYPPQGCGDNSWSGCHGPPTFANGPGSQGPRMYQGPGPQMNFEGSRWQDPRPQMLPHQHLRGPVPPGFQGPQPQMGPGNFQGPRPLMVPGDFQGPRPHVAPGDFQGPRPQMGPGDFQGPRPQMGPGDFQGPRPQIGPGDFQGPRPQMGPDDFQGPRPQMGLGDFPGPRPRMGPGDFQGPRPQMGTSDFQRPRPHVAPGDFQGPRPQMGPDDFQGPRPQMGPGDFQGTRPPMAPDDFHGPVLPPGYCGPPSQMPGCQSSRPPMPANNRPYTGRMPQMCQGPVLSVPPTNCRGSMPPSWQGPQMPNGPRPWMHNNGGENNFVKNEFNETGRCIPPQNEFQGPSGIGPVKNHLPNHRYNPVGSNRNH